MLTRAASRRERANNHCHQNIAGLRQAVAAQNQQCREHAQQREQRQQRGNEKLGKQGLQRHFTEPQQLQRQISEQSRHKYGQNLV